MWAQSNMPSQAMLDALDDTPGTLSVVVAQRCMVIQYNLTEACLSTPSTRAWSFARNVAEHTDTLSEEAIKSLAIGNDVWNRNHEAYTLLNELVRIANGIRPSTEKVYAIDVQQQITPQGSVRVMASDFDVASLEFDDLASLLHKLKSLEVASEVPTLFLTSALRRIHFADMFAKWKRNRGKESHQRERFFEAEDVIEEGTGKGVGASACVDASSSCARTMSS